VHLGDNAEARTWARNVNEFVADVVRERPGSFGLFATLTLPDVDGALAEAAYAFDELDADGVVLLTNVGVPISVTRRSSRCLPNWVGVARWSSCTPRSYRRQRYQVFRHSRWTSCWTPPAPR
jgi:hypothetical protein